MSPAISTGDKQAAKNQIRGKGKKGGGSGA